MRSCLETLAPRHRLSLQPLFGLFLLLAVAAWRRYISAAEAAHDQADTSQYSLTDVFYSDHLANAPHQKGVRWLTEIFSRSAEKFPDLTALQIPHTGESLTFAELDARAEDVAAAIFPFLSGPDQVVAVAMPQDNWQIVACHLGILKAGGTVMFLDTTLPAALVTHMLSDAQPVVVLTHGQDKFGDLPTLDVMGLPEGLPRAEPPTWLDDPTQRLAVIFYTSGTTGMPKGVECPHAGYVNLALSYADYFDLIPGLDATSLTSSLGYDGSISEMYSAWVSGCAVVMLTKEQIRSGPDLVPVLCEAEVTVLFCPPVLLTTLTPAPEMDLPYPVCRYIVPAGESFPSALVEPWTRGRRQIINTYGPTEASTDTSRQSLRPWGAHHHWLAVSQCHLCHPRGRSTPPTAPRGNRRALHRRSSCCARLPEPAGANRRKVHPAPPVRPPLPHRGQMQNRHPEHSACTSSAESTRSSRYAGIASRCRPLRTSSRPTSTRSKPPFWTTRTRRLSPLSRRRRCAKARFRPSLQRLRSGVRGDDGDSAKQLPAPSVPTKIFLVEKFAMKSVSGKIDR